MRYLSKDLILKLHNLFLNSLWVFFAYKCVPGNLVFSSTYPEISAYPSNNRPPLHHLKCKLVWRFDSTNLSQQNEVFIKYKQHLVWLLLMNVLPDLTFYMSILTFFYKISCKILKMSWRYKKFWPGMRGKKLSYFYFRRGKIGSFGQNIYYPCKKIYLRSKI